MVNVVRGATDRLSDFRSGSVTRTLLEAPSAEIESLYLEMYHGITEAIPVAIYEAFSFARLPAVAAYGEVTFSANAETTVSLGTEITTATGVRYQTTAPVVVPAGGSATVAVQCTDVGAAGNVSAGALSVLPSAIVGITSVSNAETIITGRDIETDLERKARFGEYVRTLQRGTGAALEYGAKTATILDAGGNVIEYVREAAIIEEFIADPTQPVGFVRVVISSGTGAASEDLVSRAQEVIDGYTAASGEQVAGWKAAGVIATVESAIEVEVDVSATIESDGTVENADVLAACTAAVGDYVSGLRMGEDALVSSLIVALKTVPGVYNVDLSAPASDIVVDAHEIAVVGTVSLT